MNRSAASLFVNRGSPAPRSARWSVAPFAGALVLGILDGTEAAAQNLDRYSCTKGLSQRIIEIRYGSTGTLPCEVWYGTAGHLRRHAASRNTPGVCESVARNIYANLANDGFACSEPRAREQPAGSADAPTLTREDEIVQAGKAAVQTCLPRLRQVEDDCESSPFTIRVVGTANTPMAIGGADVPVLVVQVRSAQGDAPERAGAHYLVSQERPATIRIIDEAYEEFEAVWSADLNDDGRTEVMVFTHTTPRRGHATTSFVVIGDARTLGYASAFEASGQAHDAYVLEARTGGYHDLIALTGDAVFECHYQSGYQCGKLMPLDVETPP
jgi:hypothetical protein